MPLLIENTNILTSSSLYHERFSAVRTNQYSLEPPFMMPMLLMVSQPLRITYVNKNILLYIAAIDWTNRLKKAPHTSSSTANSSRVGPPSSCWVSSIEDGPELASWVLLLSRGKNRQGMLEAMLIDYLMVQISFVRDAQGRLLGTGLTAAKELIKTSNSLATHGSQITARSQKDGNRKLLFIMTRTGNCKSNI